MNVHKPSRIPHALPRSVTRFAQIFAENGYELFLVGGAIRNILTGRPPQDFDFTSNARPEQVTGMFRRVLPTGVQHGTVTVLFSGESFEVTTYRSETGYSDHRRPDSIDFVSRIEDDLARRDFTFNALAYEPGRKEFLDLHGGVRDLEERTVRAIGDPHKRFAEDALRIIRAVRFAAQLGFGIEPETFAAMQSHASTVSTVAVERIQAELNKLLLSPHPSSGLFLLRDAGLLSSIMPELEPTVGFVQGGRHVYPLFEHLARACDAAPARLPVRLAALLHDAGKPAAVVRDGDEILHFHHHETISAEITENALRRLRYPNRVVSEVSALVRQHMFGYSSEWSDAAVRRFIARVGAELIPDLLSLRQADSMAVTGKFPDTRLITEFEKRIEAQMEAREATTIADLAVNGNDLIAAGIPAGPLLGVVLRELLDTVIDDPSQNDRESLIGLAMAINDRIKNN